MTECDKKYVLIKQGCSYVRRVVHTESKRKYVQLNNEKVYLSSIKGQYRYTDQ